MLKCLRLLAVGFAGLGLTSAYAQDATSNAHTTAISGFGQSAFQTGQTTDATGATPTSGTATTPRNNFAKSAFGTTAQSNVHVNTFSAERMHNTALLKTAGASPGTSSIAAPAAPTLSAPVSSGVSNSTVISNAAVSPINATLAVATKPTSLVKPVAPLAVETSDR